MRLQEWLWGNLYYRFFGCYNSENQKPIFDYIASVVPKSFRDKKICDLGCGDGENTLRIKQVFNAKEIVGYDRNEHLIKKAKAKGLRIMVKDLNQEMPHGELACFTMSLHHLTDKE